MIKTSPGHETFEFLILQKDPEIIEGMRIIALLEFHRSGHVKMNLTTSPTASTSPLQSVQNCTVNIRNSSGCFTTYLSRQSAPITQFIRTENMQFV